MKSNRRDPNRRTGRTVNEESIALQQSRPGERVFTVGVGTTSGDTIGFGGWSMRVRLDEDTLKSIAKMTEAEYFYAGSASDLKKVYQTLTSRLVLEKKETAITALFAAAGAALALISAALSLAWFSRIL